MGSFRTFLKSGHPPTLFAAFIYFDFCFAIWVLNGAMAPFISEEFHLTAGQKGFMISVPILAGAIMRFPLGVLAQYIGRKYAAMTEMSLIIIALLYGYFGVHTYNDVLFMGVLLGIAGASFGVALSLGSGWFPPKYKGLAMGIAGAGNSGTVLAVLLAPPLAMQYGFRSVYGFAALFMLVPMIIMLIFAKEPPDKEHQSLKQHLSCLFDKDGWVFNLVYIVTFGGFIGLSNFLPTYFTDQFGVTKVEAGQLTMLAALMGSGIRVIGGWASDKLGGLKMLSIVFVLIIILMTLTGMQTSLFMTTVFFILCFAALGLGNGSLFQLVPLRWPTTTAVAGSMIGEIGAIGGSIIPNLMGFSKGHTGSYSSGFFIFAGIAVVAFTVLLIAARKWTKSWVGPGGKALPIKAVESILEDALAVGSSVVSTLSKTKEYFRRIVYPVGNSALAEKAAENVARICSDKDTKVVVLYVEERWSSAGAENSDSPEWKQIRDQWVEEGKSILHNEKSRLSKLGVQNIEIEMRHGDVASEIVESANAHEADLIVLASHHSSPVGQLLMGSRTYSVFKTAACPILRIIR